jgi:hypothetical protein
MNLQLKLTVLALLLVCLTILGVSKALTTESLTLAFGNVTGYLIGEGRGVIVARNGNHTSTPP